MATDGSLAFYAWMTTLTAVALVGAKPWATRSPAACTSRMTDHVSWGSHRELRSWSASRAVS